jgi:lipoprotein-anchoring transpeptidase ErfK/SrfK
MRANIRPALITAVVLAALFAALSVDAVHGDNGSGIPGETRGPANVTGVATRGTSVQATPTLPPPPEPTPVATTPADTDRNIVHLDSLDLPADSGWGRRVVYSKGLQRVWMIEEDGSIYNTHRVSGRMDQPLYGTYAVYSRSPSTCSNVHPDICMRLMVRFAHSFRGDNIGFHEIPAKNGVPLQTEEKLGAPLSGGCVRQSTGDAIVMWNWAQLGTVVVVVP